MTQIVEPTLRIDSLQNPRLKAARALRDRKGRRGGRLLIDGPREIRRAIDAGVEIAELFVTGDLLTGDAGADAAAVLAQATTGATVIIEASSRCFAKLAYGDRRGGLVAVAQARWPTLDDLRFSATPLVVVAAGVEKPGNLGAVVRTADAVGADAVIATGPGADAGNPNCIRASQGLVFALPTVVAEETATLAWLCERGLAIFAAWVDGDATYYDANFTGATALVLGAEDRGLSALWRGDGVHSIRLPMRGAGDSLNVSAAAAVLLFETQRQRDAVRRD